MTAALFRLRQDPGSRENSTSTGLLDRPRPAHGDSILRRAIFAAGLTTLLLLALSPGLLCGLAMAFEVPKDSKLDSALYKPSAELVRSLLSDEHIRSKIDQEGDLEITFHGHDVPVDGWIVFDKMDDGTIWNLRFTAPVPDSETADIDRNSLLRFANNWNRDEIAVKLYVDEDGVLQTEHDLPTQFGLNPQEFLENGIRLYENALGRIVDALAEARGGGGGNDSSPDENPNGNSSSGGANGNEQPQKSTAPPDDEGSGI
jgi:hypothetical protein